MIRRLRAASLVKKDMILAWSPIRPSVEKVFTVTGQNATVINLENSKIKGQLIWDY